MLRLFLLILFPLSIYASMLHEAVQQMNVKALEKAIKSTPDINTVYKGKTALALAVENGNIEMAKRLLEANADVNKGRLSPMNIALLADNSTMAELLNDYRANLPQAWDLSNETLIYDLLLQKHYNTVAFLLNKGASFQKQGQLNAFSLALSFAPLSLIETFIQHDADLNYKDPYLDRPLDITLRLKRHDVLKLLIEHDVDVNDANFLELAVAHGDVESLKMLVNAGCTIDSEHKNLLILAVKLGNLAILKELVQAGSSLDFTESNGESVLTQAIKYKNREIIHWLLQAKLDPTAHEKSIYYAILNGDMETLTLLAERGIGLRTKPYTGLTPILYANKLKEFSMVEYLLSFDVDVDAKDDLGENALFKSIRFYQEKILTILIDKTKKINDKNKLGVTPLDLSLLTANFKAFKILLAADAKVDEEILMLSVKKGLERFFIKLKDKFFLPSIKDAKENSLLHIAAANNRTGILQRLILDGLNLQLRNDRGETALHVAAKEGNKESCSLLLSFDANATVQDQRGNTPMNLAFKSNYTKLGKWLESYQIKQEEQLNLKKEQELHKDNNESTISRL